jgi:hypothetical protein
MEPRVGQEILYAMLDEARAKTKALHVSLYSRVIGVLKNGDAVTGVRVDIGKSAREIRSKVLIDATEWGDVIPLTGARYRVGNCTSDAIDPKRQIQDNTWTATVKQYPHGVPAELTMKAPPPGYDAVRARFEKTLVKGDEPQPGNVRPWNWGTFIGYRGMPNSEQPANPAITRTHLNFNNDYPTTIADVENPASRLATNRAAILRTLQLLYYIQHDLGKADWSVANDEGFDTAYNRAQMDAWIAERPELAPYREILYRFSIIPYVRESRRIIGLHTLLAREIERKPGKPVQFTDTVALGDYAVDLHGSKKPELLELDLDRAEDIPHETFGQKGVGPFAIPFGCFIPETVDGFLAAEKNISQTRLVNGATRLQPSTMLMGQAAGAIAGLAAKKNVPPRRVTIERVQLTLLEAGDTLFITPFKDIAKRSWEWVPAQMAAVRGLVPVEDGNFRPDDPVSGKVLRQSVERSGRGGAFFDGLTQTDSLEQVRRLNVWFPFHTTSGVGPGTGAEWNEPATRLELARFFTEELLGREREHVASDKLELIERGRSSWPAPRARTPLTRADTNPQLAGTLRLLAQRKLIDADASEYWLEHAVEGGTCDGALVLELVRKAVLIRDPDAAPAALWDLAQQDGFVGSADYWKKHAVPGGECSGTFVSTILRNLAQKTGRTK